jgi:CubicO group peptidase (beta-lactamase class C family)
MRAATTWLLAAACAGAVQAGASARAADGPGRETSGAASPGARLPDTPAGRQLAAWLAAFNSNDRETIRKFNLDHLAAPNLEQLKREGRTDLYWRVAEMSGGLEIARVQNFSARDLVAEARMKRAGGWVRIELAVEASEPHKISRMRLGQIPGPSVATPAGKLSDDQVAKALGDQLDRLASSDEFSGVVLVAKGGKPIFSRAYGDANKERHVPNRLDTKFSLASMGKMFTAVAIAQLVEQGKLSYDDTVGKHLPDYPNKDVARKVTIHQLLTHTSGLGDFFNERWKERRASLRTVKDYLDLFADKPLEFEPGTRWRYSNGGFVVLGAIIERVTGRDYYEYVAEHVFKPAGMARTGFFTPEESADDMATGYTTMGADDKPRSGPRRSNAEHRPGRGNPAGGAWSTAGDLARFAEALRDGKLLDPRSAATLTEPMPGAGMGPEEQYGYGFMSHTVHGHRAFGHFGGFPGVSTALEVYPDVSYTVVILSNYDEGAPRVLMPLRDWIARD